MPVPYSAASDAIEEAKRLQFERGYRDRLAHRRGPARPSQPYEEGVAAAERAMGFVPMEPLARREFGNTNYAILIQRAEEARALLE